MYSVLQRDIATVYGWIPTWWVPNTESFVVPQFEVGRFWRQCTRTIGAFQHRASYSSHRVQWLSIQRSQFFQSFYSGPLWFSQPSSLTNQHHLLQLRWQPSTGRTVKAASLSPLHSVSKQDTSDARSSRPGSANIISVCPHTLTLEKKWWVQRSDAGKKLNCRKSLCEKHNKQRQETAEENPFRRQIGLSNRGEGRKQ